MGYSPFSCLTSRDCLRVVYPDGHVENLSRPCSVYELLLGNPDYFVCYTAPFTIANRMAADVQLEIGLTYFVCPTPNAQPFMDFSPKKPSKRSRLLSRFSKGTSRGRQILGSPIHMSAQSGKVYDFHSAAMQLETMNSVGGSHSQQSPCLAAKDPPKYLIKVIFFRHCLKALRIPKDCMKLMEPTPPGEHPKTTIIESQPTISLSRSELGGSFQRRQNISCPRRGRRRRKFVFKPVLQSISEGVPIEDFTVVCPAEESASVIRYSCDPQQQKPTFERSVYVA